jgi:hypothetical protein
MSVFHYLVCYLVHYLGAIYTGVTVNLIPLRIILLGLIWLVTKAFSRDDYPNHLAIFALSINKQPFW